jgi:ABC-2 type transport system ATP-binding protein
LGKVRAENDMTVFLTTHYLEEAERADTICILDHGKVVALGTPDQVKARLVENYLLIDAENRDALRQELRAHKVAFIETPMFKIELNGSSPQHYTTHQLLKMIDTPLTTVQLHTPSVEDAYLAIISEHDHDHPTPSQN